MCNVEALRAIMGQYKDVFFESIPWMPPGDGGERRGGGTKRTKRGVIKGYREVQPNYSDLWMST